MPNGQPNIVVFWGDDIGIDGFVSLTLNANTHILPTLRRDAADRLDAVLGAN